METCFFADFFHLEFGIWNFALFQICSKSFLFGFQKLIELSFFRFCTKVRIFTKQILSLEYPSQDEKYVHQVEKHLKILKTHTSGRPGARMENNKKLVEVRTKMAIIEAQYNLSKEQYTQEIGFFPIFSRTILELF